MAIELNVAQVIGYSVQVLLILALLVALSIRSWPFLIAIVFMGLVALGLACVRTANTNSKKHSAAEQSNMAAEAPELDSGERNLDEVHEEYGTYAPPPPIDIDSLDNVRQVSLALEGKEVAEPSKHSSKPTTMNQIHRASLSSAMDARANFHRASLSSAMEGQPTSNRYHQEAEFGGSRLYAEYLAQEQTKPRPRYEQRAPQPNTFVGMGHGPPSRFQGMGPPRNQHNTRYNRAQLAHQQDPDEYEPYAHTNVRQYTSPFAKASMMTTPDDLERKNRELRWMYQSAPHMNGLPFASRHVLNQLGRADWDKPDPNLVPVNPRARNQTPSIMRPKMSPWATASYLHRR